MGEIEKLLKEIRDLLGGTGLPVLRDELKDGRTIEKWREAFTSQRVVMNPVFLSGLVAQESDGGEWTYRRLEDPGSDGISTSRAALPVLEYGHLYNGATWDRIRNNTEFTALASAARTATTNSDDFVNYNARGGLFFLDISVAFDADHAGVTVQMIVQAKDPVSGNYVSLETGTATTAVGTTTLAVYPGVTDASAEIANQNDIPLPRTFRVRVVHSSGGPATTYSVGAALVI